MSELSEESCNGRIPREEYVVGDKLCFLDNRRNLETEVIKKIIPPGNNSPVIEFLVEGYGDVGDERQADGTYLKRVKGGIVGVIKKRGGRTRKHRKHRKTRHRKTQHRK